MSPANSTMYYNLKQGFNTYDMYVYDMICTYDMYDMTVNYLNTEMLRFQSYTSFKGWFQDSAFPVLRFLIPTPQICYRRIKNRSKEQEY